MLNRRILKTSTILWALIISSTLAWGGQKKNNNPPPSAPPRPAAQPQRPTTPPHTPSGPGPHTPSGPGPHAGPFTYQGRPGDQQKALPGNRKEFHNANGQTVTTNARGEVRRIEAHRGLAGTDRIVINRTPRGGRVVETGRPGSRVVSYGRNHGFVERPLRAGYMSRTYFRGDRRYAHVYHEYGYHDRRYYRYVAYSDEGD